MLREKNNRWIENTWYIPKKYQQSRENHIPPIALHTDRHAEAILEKEKGLYKNQKKRRL